MRDRSDLRPEQANEVIPFLRANPFSAAYLYMGFGKTGTFLTLVADLIESGELKPDELVLVLGPLRVMARTWTDEVGEWSHLSDFDVRFLRPAEDDPSLPVAVKTAQQKERDYLRKYADSLEAAFARNTKARNPSYNAVTRAGQRAHTAQLEVLRRNLLSSGGQIHTLDRDRLPWLVDVCSERKHWPYKVVICDESTGFADYSTERWKALKQVRPYLKRLHMLSGTPCPEGVQQFFGQIGLLDQGQRLGRNITAFRRSYMMPKWGSRGWDPQPGAMERACQAISDIVMIVPEPERTSEQMPRILDRAFDLPPELMEQYKQFENEMILDLPDGTEIEAETAGELCQKLLQFSSGFVYEMDRLNNRKLVHRLHEEKIEDLRQIKAEAREMGSPLLVGYWFKPSLETIRKAFPKAVVLDKDGSQIKDWTAGKIDMMLLHPQGGAHGLNLQLGPGHIGSFYEMPSSLELYLQFIKRLDRPGQKKQVSFYRQYARGTYEAAGMGRLKNKEDVQEFAKQYLIELRRKRKHG